MLGVAVGTMALIIVLSVFNGLEDVLRSVYNTYDPELKVSPTTGKSFSLSIEELEEIRSIEGITGVSKVIEDNALARYNQEQVVVRLKGVEKSFLITQKLDTFLMRGELRLQQNDKNYAILGAGVAYALGARLNDGIDEIELIYPKNIHPGALPNPNAIRRVNVTPSAIISVDVKIDESLLMTSFDAAEEVLDYSDRMTGLEIYVAKSQNLNNIKNQLQERLGNEFVLLDSDEQHGELLRAVKIEKLFVYIALTFITLIASFNIFFSLSMLAIEKKKDIAILLALGATAQTIRRIFLKQGFLIAGFGAVLGLILGLLFCYLQDRFGLVGMGMPNAVVQAYPVKVIALDVVGVTLSVFLIAILTSFRPATLAARIEAKKELN